MGHEAEMARDVLGPGATDTSILEKAVREGSIIITADHHFGDLVFKGGKHHVGVVLLRLKDQRAANQVRKILEALQTGQVKSGVFVTIRD
ncbi:MAG: DUF5615 family PIN-like protein [Moorellales bacterium]